MPSMNRFRSLFLILILAAFAGLCRAEEFEKPDDPPVPVRTPPPSYPAELKRDGVSGMVVVSLVVDSDGSVTDVAISKSTHKEFEAPAVDAVRKWKFKPAKKAGNAIRSKVALPLKFSAE